MKTIPLTKGKVALVDDEDYERVAQYKWHVKNNGYAMRTAYTEPRRRVAQYLHRFLLDAPHDMQVDHINHDRLDCRRENLRLVVPRQNSWNLRFESRKSSRFHGVHWNGKVWIAQITINGRAKHLGRFHDEIEAALAYDRMARLTRGEYAAPNFPGWLAPDHDPRCLEVKP